MFGPMDLSRSGAKVQMQPDTGVTFADVVGVDGAKLVSQQQRSVGACFAQKMLKKSCTRIDAVHNGSISCV